MNKKLTKLLSVFLIAGLIGTGTAVGVAGCKKTPSNKPANNQTEQDITWNMKGHGTKPSDAAAKTSGGMVTKPQVDPSDDDYDFGGWFSDDACTTSFNFNKTYSSAVTVYAKWTAKTSQGGEDDPPASGINIVKEFNKDDFDNATDNGGSKYYAVGDEVIDGVTVVGTGDFQIESNNKKIYINGAEKSVGYRVKFGGDLFTAKGEGAEAYKELNRALKVEVEENATLVIYGTAGGSNKKAYISLATGETTGEGAEAVTKLTIVDTQQICYKNTEMNAVIFELEAGKTYYVGSDTKTNGDPSGEVTAATMYYMELKSDFDEGKGEKVDAQTATCEGQGNVAHYYTDYGRYLDETGEDVLNPFEVFSDALGHKWTYTTVTNPTATNPGSVTLTCGRNSAHTRQVNLPALTNSVYTRTEITTGDDAGKYTYSMEYPDVYNGEEKVNVITFVDVKVSEAKTAYVDISGFKYEEAQGDAVMSAKSDEPKSVGNGTLKLTAGANKSGEMGANKNLNVSFYDGAINLTDTEPDNILFGVLGFDEAKTTGVYRVSGLLNAVEAGSWDPVQIVTSTDITSVAPTADKAPADEANDGRILFALSSDGSKKYCMRFNGVRREASEFDVTDKKSYYFRLDIDLDNHIASVSLSEDGKEFKTIDTVNDPTISTFAGIRFQTGSGSRSFSVEQLMLSQKMEVDAVVGEYTYVESKYALNANATANELDYVLSTEGSVKVNNDGTTLVNMYGTKMEATWEKADGYYTGTMSVQMAPGAQPTDVTMYTVLDEETGLLKAYLDMAGNTPVATVLAGTPYMVYLIDGGELTQDIKDALAAVHYGEVAPGELENPIVIPELSAEAITATEFGRSNCVFYTYKNKGAELVTITVVPDENTAVFKVTPIADGWGHDPIVGSFTVDAGETILISASPEDEGGISFVFRAYNAATDGAVKYDIELDTKGIKVDCPAKLQTNEEGKLEGLPTLDSTPSAEFLGWELEDGTEVDEDTVFDKNTTIYAKWNITVVTVAQQTNTFTYSAIAAKADNAALVQADFDLTANKFLQIDSDNGGVIYRTSNSCIQVTNGGLKVYFGAAGTLKLGVSSTGGSNDSLIGIKNEDDEYIASKTTGLTAAAEGTEVYGNSVNVALNADAVGSYIIHGTGKVTLEFVITEAGWYTIYSDSTQTTRGSRVMDIEQVVDEYEVPEAEFTVTSVTLDQTEVTVDEQDSVTITADIETQIGVYVSKIEWKTSDAEVATVEDGVITVHKKGDEGDTVVITCEVTDSRGEKKSATVTVTVNHVGATGVSITDDADDGTLKKDDTVQLHYEATVDGDGEATDVAVVQWDSSDKSVATVDDDGLVTIKGSGTTNITVTITKIDGTTKTSEAYAITVAAVAATGLKDIAGVTVTAGKTVDIVVEVEPADANGYDLTYQSASTAVATVDNSGKVTGVAEGTTTVTVTLKIGEDTIATKECAVTVEAAPVITGTLVFTTENTCLSDTNIAISCNTGANMAYINMGDADTPIHAWRESSGKKGITITNNSTETLYITVTSIVTNGAGEQQNLKVMSYTIDGADVTNGATIKSSNSADTVQTIAVAAGKTLVVNNASNNTTLKGVSYTSVAPTPTEG